MRDKNTPRSTLTHVGAWKLGRTLGRGAYAHVRLATHQSGHKAACKILPALHSSPGVPVSWDQTVDAIEAHKEVVLLKALSGAGVPGIVGLEGVIVQAGWTYVFLALYPHSASRYDPPWEKSTLVIFFRQLLNSVHNLHLLNVSHEDIKRSNVLVDSSGLPALIDFGFSHFRPGGGLVESAGGTLDYSSPEKTADVMYDPKANDVWSLGILLTKLLGIHHPYSASSNPDDTSLKVKDRIISGEPLYFFPKEYRKSGGVGDLIKGMLERDPVKRWTIPDVLRHPFLQTRHQDKFNFVFPSCSLSFMHRIPLSVVEDVCFLAHLNGEFALCETPARIERRLCGDEPCWEKQWAGMLGAWSKRAEMDWEAIPVAITPVRKPKAQSDPTDRTRPMNNIKARALREIHLTPNAQLRPDPGQTTASTTLNNQGRKENEPPRPKRKPPLYGMKTKEPYLKPPIRPSDNASQDEPGKPSITIRAGKRTSALKHVGKCGQENRSPNDQRITREANKGSQMVLGVKTEAHVGDADNFPVDAPEGTGKKADIPKTKGGVSKTKSIKGSNSINDPIMIGDSPSPIGARNSKVRKGKVQIDNRNTTKVKHLCETTVSPTPDARLKAENQADSSTHATIGGGGVFDSIGQSSSREMRKKDGDGKSQPYDGQSATTLDERENDVP